VLDAAAAKKVMYRVYKSRNGSWTRDRYIDGPAELAKLAPCNMYAMIWFNTFDNNKSRMHLIHRQHAIRCVRRGLAVTSQIRRAEKTATR
jgi:hypothetical protein